MCTAVLDGIYPGKIFVDDPTSPTSALLTTFLESEQRSVWGFFAGESRNEDFNHALNRAIFAREILHPETPVFLLTCDHDFDDEQVEAVMAPRHPIWMPRWHYVCRQVNFEWHKQVPDGFVVQPMRIEMLQDDDLDLPDDVRATLEKWANAESEHFADFGFVTIDQTGEKSVIAGWATVDFIAQQRGDLGFFTQPEYRRKGLGTIAAAAALDHGLSNGLTQINWTCDAGNQGSIGTANKLGLERIADYQMAMLVFDEAEHLGNLGYYAFLAKDYALSANSFERSLELNPDTPNFIYYEAAQAMAMTGNHEKAFAFLSQAFQRGWKDIEHAQQCKAFASLREFPRWKELIQKME
jgi:RimJ/RimL family protein N-acetyltransferase